MQDKRVVVYDRELQVEAYRFHGIMQKFPNHFHEYYVIGYVERGHRSLSCKGQNYLIHPGDIVLLNPNENHSCSQVDEQPLDWRCINIKHTVMGELLYDLEQGKALPVFTTTVIKNPELAEQLKDLHQRILDDRQELEKEELLYFIIKELTEDYTQMKQECLSGSCLEIEKACTYMQENYEGAIGLKDLCQVAGLGKYTLLRYFVQQKGVTPYQYLESVRISEAKKSLEKGVDPLQTALQCGFHDQSHFTRFFKRYIGLTPRQYMNVFKESRQD